MQHSIWRPLSALSLLLFSLSFVPGCSEPTAPLTPPPPEGTAIFQGSFGGAEFVLQRLDQTGPDGSFVQIELVGKNLAVDDTGDGVTIDVAVRNLADRRGARVNLYPQLVVWLENLRPSEVRVTNADFVLPDSLAVLPILPGDSVWGFDYSDELGDDGVLSPGETSGYRSWHFLDPGLVSFSFRANLQFGLQPNRPTVGGVVFTDLNRNGIFDGAEEGTQLGSVQLDRPDGGRQMVDVGLDGSWSLPAKEAGLYTVTYHPPPFATPLPFCLTTPNPLRVLLAPAPEGGARSYDQANFGIDPAPCVSSAFPPVILRDRRPADVPRDPYQLLEVQLQDRHLLRLRIGFSGCSGDHPIRLFAGGQFAETSPEQTWALLSHDSRGELCLAYFEEERVFDLSPLIQRHLDQYGSRGPFDLVLEDFSGAQHRIRVP